jgi:hypothetical protein
MPNGGKRLHEIPAIIFGIAPQRAAETGRICDKLELAVAEVEAMTWPAPSARFSELVRHARELHSMLVEALLAVESEVPRNVYVISDEVNAAIADLEDVVRLLGSLKH